MATSSGPAKAGGAASQRACLRCIAKKRRCDHERPVCGSCGKLKVSCEYPPPQSRRGPVPGLSKRAEWRVQQCENALWYLINLPGVAGAVQRAVAAGATGPLNGVSSGNSTHQNGTGASTRAGSAEDGENTFATAPTSTLDRESRAEWWSSHRLDAPGDILEFQRACRTLSGDHGPDTVDDRPLAPPPVPIVAPEPRSVLSNTAAAAPSVTSVPPPTSSSTPTGPTSIPPGVPPAQIYTPASGSLRNSMGPSLWQLVTAAIPDADNAGFTRELLELRARRERAVAMAGESDLVPRDDSEWEREHERDLQHLRQMERERVAGRDTPHRVGNERQEELREEARAELAVFEREMAREAEEEREYEARRARDREERRARDTSAAESRPASAGPAEKRPADAEEDRERFPGLRLPLGGVLPNEHLAWTYGASGVGGMSGVGGAGGKRRRLEDMFW